MKELMPLDNVNAVAVFSEGGLDKLLENVEKEARSHVPDLTTDKGRKAIASMSAKVSSSKTYLDGLGKELVSGWKAKSKAVDGERRKMRDRLDVLKAEIRKPLTDWEDAEKLRIENLLRKINSIESSGAYVSENWLELSLETMNARLTDLINVIHFGYDEYEPRATMVMDAAAVKILDSIDRREKHDAEQAELETLRQEKVEREEKERKEKAAKAKIAHDKEIADQATKVAEKKAADDKKVAEKKAADDKKAAAKKAADQKKKIIADKQAAQAREKAAKENAKRLAKEAAQREREKIAAEQKAEKDAAAKREANKTHHKKINNQSVDSLVAAGIEKETAVKVVTVIAQKKITNISIQY